MNPEVLDLPSHACWSIATQPVSPTDIHPRERALLRPSAGEKRRSEFCLGRWAAHEALRMLGADVDVVGRGAGGQPLWPVGITGSIAHGAGAAIALVARSHDTEGVGVDLERACPMPELEGYVPRPEERAWLETYSPRDRARELIALFSAKEAVFKAFYPRVGRFFGFEAVLFERDDGGYRGRFAVPVDDGYSTERSFHVASRWTGDVVVSWLILPGS